MPSIDKQTMVGVLGTLLALFFFIGCNTHSGPYVPDSNPNPVEDKYPVVLLEKSLKRVVAVDHVSARPAAGGRLQAKATMRNLKKHRQHIQIQTVFKDEENFSTGEDSGWEDIILSPKETRTYSCKSMTTKPVSFTIRVRCVPQ